MAHKDLASSIPFPGKHKVIKGEPANHIKPSKVKRQKKELHVNAVTRTDLVKGPLKAKGKHNTRPKRTMVKA